MTVEVNLNSYRLISNLTLISKTLERLIDARFTKHADKDSLFPVNQSAYRKHHSTESAMVRTYNDLINAVDLGHVGALVLLDLSSAFDTVDHQVMLNVLVTSAFRSMRYSSLLVQVILRWTNASLLCCIRSVCGPIVNLF